MLTDSKHGDRQREKAERAAAGVDLEVDEEKSYYWATSPTFRKWEEEEAKSA